MNKLQKQQLKMEKQLLQQELDERWLSGKNYGTQEPVIKKTKAKGRKVTINAYSLITAIKNALEEYSGDEAYIKIPLGFEKELALDLRTREALYFNDKTGEESYLDNIEFYQAETEIY